jgi:hypothetical protein
MVHRRRRRHCRRCITKHTCACKLLCCILW